MIVKPSSTPGGKARENLLKILNHALEEELVLSTRMRDVLGRITAPNFDSLYRLFGDQCRQAERWLGEIRARTRAFGTIARAGAGEMADSARAAMGAPPVASRNMIRELLELHERIAARIRQDLVACREDSGTADFLTRLAEFHETAAWMLRTVLGRDVPRPNH